VVEVDDTELLCLSIPFTKFVACCANATAMFSLNVYTPTLMDACTDNATHLLPQLSEVKLRLLQIHCFEKRRRSILWRRKLLYKQLESHGIVAGKLHEVEVVELGVVLQPES
jgi:hypothetical protein